MRILRVLCILFSQQSAGREPLALSDLTHLKPLPCPVSWPYQPLHVCPPPLPYPLASPPMSGPPSLPCTQALPPSTGQASLLYPVPRPYYPSQVGPPLPLPPAPAFALPVLTGASPLFNDLCYNTCLLLPWTFLLLSSFPFSSKGPSSHP